MIEVVVNVASAVKIWNLIVIVVTVATVVLKRCTTRKDTLTTPASSVGLSTLATFGYLFKVGLKR